MFRSSAQKKGVHEACQTIILSLPLESLMIRKAH